MKVFALNVQQGAGKRAARLATVIEGETPEVVVLTEQRDRSSAGLTAMLMDMGLRHQVIPTAENGLGVGVFSCLQLEPLAAAGPVAVLPGRWTAASIWARLLEALQREADAARCHDWDTHYVDGTVVRVRQHAAGAAGRYDAACRVNSAREPLKDTLSAVSPAAGLQPAVNRWRNWEQHRIFPGETFGACKAPQ